MTNGEKLGYDSEKLKKYFAEFVKAWPDKANMDWNGCLPAYESLSLDYRNYNYKTFVDWMNNEFKEFKHLDLLPGGIIVLDKDNENITFVKALDIFSSGWAFHLNLLKDRGYDISKPWAIVAKDHKVCRTVLKYEWSETDKAEMLEDIDKHLLELDRSKEWNFDSKEPYHYTVHCKPEEWPFYRTFAKVLRTLKVKIQNNDFKWDEEMLKEMM